MAVQKRTTPTGKIRWVARYRDKTGREHSKSFDTQREAKQHIADQQVALTRGTWTDPTKEKTTLGSLVEEWVTTGSEASRPFRTSLMRNLGPLADHPVGTLTPADVRAWVATLQTGRPWKGNTPLGTSAVASALANVKLVLEQAVDDGLIPKNPARRVTAPTPTTRVTWHDIPTKEQIDQLIRYARTGYGKREKGKKYSWFQAHPDLSVMIRVSAATGLRPGEVAGLRWQNVDFDNGQILVMEQAMRAGAGTQRIRGKRKRVHDGVCRVCGEPRGAGRSPFMTCARPVCEQILRYRNRNGADGEMLGRIDRAQAGGATWKMAAEGMGMSQQSARLRVLSLRRHQLRVMGAVSEGVSVDVAWWERPAGGVGKATPK